MTIPYRIRRLLRRFAVILLVLLLFFAAVGASWLLWLSRYVVYTEDGVKIDFSLSPATPTGEQATAPTPGETVSIIYSDSDDQEDQKPAALGQIVGYRVSAEQLQENTDEVIAALEALDEGTAVSLELKTMRGNHLYSTSLGRIYDAVDVEKIDQLIRTLQEKGCYLIAELPAFRDYWYFLDDESTRVPYGLPRAGGDGALWLDSDGPNYWMNPASSGALNYMVQVITELRNLGFDEVMLYDFRFPNTEKIRFTGDRVEALQNAAATLAQTCTTDTFALSFISTQITLPEGRCRLYAEGVLASDIPNFVSGQTLSDPVAQVVFLTDLKDTRFDAYSVLRPLDIPVE